MPLEQHVTLSTEAGVSKPDRRIFKVAVQKISAHAHLHEAIFVTENADHVREARKLGMSAVHFMGPGQNTGDISQLLDLVPIIDRFAWYAPCCSKQHIESERTPSRASESASVDAEIADRVALVSGDRLIDSIKALSDFGTRWSFDANISQVPEWIQGRFLTLGYDGPNGPRFSSFDLLGSPVQQRNVLCGPTNFDSGFVLLCARYDSISEDPTNSAPGADDNASGIAVLLEVARLLKKVPLRRGVCMAAFGGEEQGLFGSQACAEIAEHDGWPIDVVINLDMIAFQESGREGRVVVEYDQGNSNANNDAAAKAFAMLMAQAAADYTSLQIEHGNIYSSDYMPFERLGYPCIGVYEGGTNPHYHTTGDKLETIEADHLAEVTKMVLATILELGK